ncbi:nitrate reductase [Psychromonas sp. MB-3u-54]|uniref:nitrate reductase n=1 Tax=Psychromonas sp. MB-3u-54 TaxID=2058319 RepID=UPI000C348AE5|nr:nitrate reductase [Psychromonas sp. MB-3u-54]PKH01712.1 nitrate reductase [Psychromonas sp. MB-3u-54]
MTAEKSLWTKTTCAYCGVGCGVEAKPNKLGLLDIRGDQDHPANYGRLCSKGLALGETVVHEGRLLTPEVNGAPSSWENALTLVADKFSDTIKQYGPDSVAFYVSGQLLTEDYYAANKLMKGFIGSGNIDTNSRLCMSSSVAGHKRAFGSDTVPVCYQDLEKTDMVVITGSNLAWCHPVLFQRLKAAKALRPELFIVVIDPRKTATCEIADCHLAIQPGSDVALFNGLLAYLAENKTIDRDYIDQYTQGFEASLASAVDECQDRDEFLKRLGIKESQLELFYKHFSQTEKVITIYSQGVNQSSQGTDKVNSILNCFLATGRIGKEGMGPFSVTGQPNAMGGREVGGLANTLAAHMEFGNEQDHQRISEFWQTEQLATKPGLKAVELFDAIDDGTIKAVWIMATNPVVSLPGSSKIKAALKKCPLVVVSDCIKETATSAFADVLLPAQGWSEKSGTITNSERRISRQRRILPTPGLGKPDWWIISEVAKKMGFAKAFDYAHEGQVFDEYVKMTGLGNRDGNLRALNLIGLAGLSANDYNQLTPQQWPVPEYQKEVVNQRMFADNLFFTENKKARLIPISQKQPLSRCSADYPFVLNNGRIRDQWHTMSRTGLSSRLSAYQPEPFVSINPIDAVKQQLENGQLVTISSLSGSVLVRLAVSADIEPGQLFMPIHWSQTTASKANICALIKANVDPNSGQPEFKFTPVKLVKWAYKSEAWLLSRTPMDLSDFDYWVKQKVAAGYLYRLAAEFPPLEMTIKLSNLMDHNSGKTLTNSPAAKSAAPIYRYANITDQKMQQAYIVGKNLQEQDLDWLQNLLEETVDSSIERSLISGQVEGKLACGKLICACKQVGEKTIKNAIAEQQLDNLKAVSEHTGAGTGCGSCLGEVEAILTDCTLLV